MVARLAVIAQFLGLLDFVGAPLAMTAVPFVCALAGHYGVMGCGSTRWIGLHKIESSIRSIVPL
jgi:hypothetical protein